MTPKKEQVMRNVTLPILMVCLPLVAGLCGYVVAQSEATQRVTQCVTLAEEQQALIKKQEALIGQISDQRDRAIQIAEIGVPMTDQGPQP